MGPKFTAPALLARRDVDAAVHDERAAGGEREAVGVRGVRGDQVVGAGAGAQREEVPEVGPGAERHGGRAHERGERRVGNTGPAVVRAIGQQVRELTLAAPELGGGVHVEDAHYPPTVRSTSVAFTAPARVWSTAARGTRAASSVSQTVSFGSTSSVSWSASTSTRRAAWPA